MNRPRFIESDLTSSTGICCAHVNVKLSVKHHGDGTCSDHWFCKDCNQRFLPVSRLANYCECWWCDVKRWFNSI